MEVVLSGVLGRKGFFSFYTANDRKLARENLEKLGILHLEKRKFSDLSGGPRQRVLIARALTAAKDVLLLELLLCSLLLLDTMIIYVSHY